MYIKKLKIENFRGIKEFECTFDNKLICLIGASDSTKTTILNSIEYVLYPYWNLNVTNTDFYMCNTDNEIKITATVGNIPEYFFNEDTFGLYIRKNVEGGIDDMPSSEDEVFLTIQLTINKLFETDWKVINNRGMERKINYKEREKLSIARIGENIDRDFYIGRNSILKKYITDTDDLNLQMFRIVQSVKKQDINISSVSDAFEKIKKVLDSYNLKLSENLNLEIEMKSSDLNISNIGISDGVIPFNRKGTGTKRLLSSILNLESNDNKSCILIDEIEYGLEPYRIADLLFKLKTKSEQSIITTHSPIPITELDSDNIFICKSNEGVTTCISVPDEFQSLLRRFPYAFLSKKILIVEGGTEWGIFRTQNEVWNKSGFSLAYSGGIVVDGHGGSGAVTFAKKFNKLGYDVSIWIDGDDNNTNKKLDNLKGIKVFRLENGFNIEKRLLNDLKICNYNRIIEIMKKVKDEDTVEKYLKEIFGTSDISAILTRDKETVSEGLYKILTKKDKDNNSIFKGTKYGTFLGKLIIELSSSDLKYSEIVIMLEEVRKWFNEI